MATPHVASDREFMAELRFMLLNYTAKEGRPPHALKAAPALIIRLREADLLTPERHLDADRLGLTVPEPIRVEPKDGVWPL